MFTNIINGLIDKKETISIVDATTVGYVTSLMAENDGFSKVIKFACNPVYDEYKVRFGVKESTLNVYDTASLEVAKEMVIGIASFTKSDYAVSIVGDIVKSNSLDPTKEQDTIYFAFFKRKTNQVFVTTLKTQSEVFELKRKDIASFVRDSLNNLILN